MPALFNRGHFLLRNLVTIGSAFTLFAVSCFPGRPLTELSAGDLLIAVDTRGRVVRLVDKSMGRNFAADAVESPLLSLQIDGVLHSPRSFAWDPTVGMATLTYAGEATASVRITPKQTHLVLELNSVDPADRIDVAVWGPYATTVSDTIGETVGVVRNSQFAIGIQALNQKTLGGLPWRDNDFPPQIDIFESGDFTDMSEEGKRHVLYRVEAAKPEGFGSTLQAYCRNRDRDRVIANWSHEYYTAPAYDDGGVVGSKIALFGSPTELALETIGRIEVEENLPHPTIDGEWGKQARSASAAYLILKFGEEDIEDAIAWTRRAGLRYLYHPEPFETWGHFELSDRFPNGRAGLRRCVDKAAEEGVMVGVHTLSNFTTTNDRYVTPVPDDRLAKVGESTITENVGARVTEIPIESPEFFAQYENNTLRTVVIGDELIQYRTVSEQAPWRLLDCQRGAFNTRAVAHQAGDTIGMLADHAYRVFLTDADLGSEVATNIAELFNETGLRQISFDGVEGNQSTGMGNYGEILFTSSWFSRLSDEIRLHYIADASRTTHYFWHIYTRMNWGEPWYAGFRESQTEYRLKNQPYFRRNYMPGMLGWFRMTEQVSIEDVEWMLARSAAFDAGYSFVTSYEALEGNGFTDRILAAIGLWERARMADAFSADQKSRMEDVRNEFTLAAVDEGSWQLTQVYPQTFRHERGVRQPGEPTVSTFQFDNLGDEQSLHWILTAEDGDVSEVSMTLDGGEALRLPARLEQGWSLRYEGGNSVTVRNAEHRRVRDIRIGSEDFLLASGPHTITFDSELRPEQEAKAKLELRPRGPTERVVTTDEDSNQTREEQ